MRSIASVVRTILALLLAAAIVGMSGSVGAAAEGHWRFQRIVLSPTQAELDQTARSQPPGRTWEAHASGAFQAEFGGKGSIEIFYKNDDADLRVFTSRATYTFGGGRDMSVLVPGDKIKIEGSVSAESNFPGATGGGTFWVDDGDNLLVIDTPIDKQGSAAGIFTVPSGGSGGTLRLQATGGVYANGALHETITIFYEWVAGPAPRPEPKPTPKPAPEQPGSGDWSGQWSTSEGDMDLSQSGGRVTGSYSQDNGHIGGVLQGDHLVGYWGEESSANECATEQLGTHFWGRIDWTLAADGKSFAGLWSYCDAEPGSSWTGTRSGGTDQGSVVPAVDVLGSSIEITEIQGWTGIWVRRPGTDIFDATWQNDDGRSASDVIRIARIDGRDVVLTRDGNGGTYYGTVSPDGRSIEGTASWYPAGTVWSGVIEGGAPGGFEPSNGGTSETDHGGEIMITPDNAFGSGNGPSLDNGGGQSPSPDFGGKGNKGWNVPAPVAATPFVDNWNTAACQLTDSATLDIKRPVHLDRFELWMKWPAGGRSADYSVSLGGQDIGGGTLRRGDCDPNQKSWCVGADAPNVDLRPGRYTIRIDHDAICQNSASGGAGFIRAWSSR